MYSQGQWVIPLDEYIRDPAPAPSLSAGIAHRLLSQSPQHAWLAHPRLNSNWRPDSNEAAEIGTIAHALLLEGDGSRVVQVHADDWRSKAARSSRDAIRQAGRLPVLANKLYDIVDMVEHAKRQLATSELGDILAPGAGDIEQTFLWQEDDVWHRSRPDWISADRRVMVDYKTTSGSAEPNAWARGSCWTLGQYLQAALAIRGNDAITHPPPHDVTWVFAVQEIEAPYALSLVGLSPVYLDFAFRQLDMARKLWATCLATDRWPGYPSRVAYIEPPGFALYQQEDRE